MSILQLNFKRLFRVLLIVTIICPLYSVEASDAEKYAFDGFYLGAAVSSQNVWGGSLIAGIDVLTEDRRAVAEASLGWRHSVFEHWVVGVEVQAGLLDGDLHREADAGGFSVDYSNNSQFGFGVNSGRILGSGRRHLLYLYAYETERNFDVKISHPSFCTCIQSDEQGFLRYGLALETAWSGRLRTKMAVGTYRVDFGDARTNINIGSDIEMSIGFVYQLRR